MLNGVKLRRTAPIQRQTLSNVPAERPEPTKPPIKEPDADDHNKDKEKIREPGQRGGGTK